VNEAFHGLAIEAGQKHLFVGRLSHLRALSARISFQTISQVLYHWLNAGDAA
jgi:hypothetical protein